MIFYTEDLLGKVYKTYQLHQAKHNMPFMRLEDFRLMFELQQQLILEQIEAEIDGDSSC
jgi:hypothetical protein